MSACHTMDIKRIVKSKKNYSVITFSPSICSETVRVSFFCWTQNKIFWRMMKLSHFEVLHQKLVMETLNKNNNNKKTLIHKIVFVLEVVFDVWKGLMRIMGDGKAFGKFFHEHQKVMWLCTMGWYNLTNQQTNVQMPKKCLSSKNFSQNCLKRAFLKQASTFESNDRIYCCLLMQEIDYI